MEDVLSHGDSLIGEPLLGEFLGFVDTNRSRARSCCRSLKNDTCKLDISFRIYAVIILSSPRGSFLSPSGDEQVYLKIYPGGRLRWDDAPAYSSPLTVYVPKYAIKQTLKEEKLMRIHRGTLSLVILAQFTVGSHNERKFI